MKIYTKTGDAGETALFDGTRVPKDHTRVAAYGDVDELNATIGLAASRLAAGAAESRSLLEEVQRDLFAVGAHLADPRGAAKKREKAILAPERIGEVGVVCVRNAHQHHGPGADRTYRLIANSHRRAGDALHDQAHQRLTAFRW